MLYSYQCYSLLITSYIKASIRPSIWTVWRMEISSSHTSSPDEEKPELKQKSVVWPPIQTNSKLEYSQLYGTTFCIVFTRFYRSSVNVAISWTKSELGSALEEQQTAADKFRTGSFLVIIDCLDAVLRKRLGAYTGIASKFGFLRNLIIKDLPDEDQSAKSLPEAYPMD